MSMDKLSQDIAALVQMHQEHTATLVDLYEKSLQAQVQMHMAEIKAAKSETDKRVQELQTLLKKAGAKP